MSDERNQWIDNLLGRMTLDHKIGQLLVFGMTGPIITPDIVELVRKYHLGGLRISLGFRFLNLFNDVKPGTEPEEWTLRSLHPPRGLNRDCPLGMTPITATASQYADTLNQLRDIAMQRDVPAPLHFTIDQEGSGSDDLLWPDVQLFPHPMGLAASGDPSLAYRTALAVARQARAVGANMIHSPVLDVNTNPRNPEIGTRAYSDNPETVTRFALESLRGFQQAKLIATGKHFPGRGESMADAHWGLPKVDIPLDQLETEHIAPYKALIEAGLPAIMMAHSVYPALGETEEPASCSRRIVTDYLRQQLGFEGVITTDNMMMGGLLQKYELREAVIRVLEAGQDLVLLRDESPIRIRIFEAIREAVKQRRLTEAEIDEKVQRILGMRYDMGLAENGGKVDAPAADRASREPFVTAACHDAAQRSVLLLRDERGVLPLSRDARVLLVEQVFPTHARANNVTCHPGLLWREMGQVGQYVASVEIANVPGQADRDRVRRRLREDDYDVIVTTNYYYHKAAAAITDLVAEMQQTGKPVVVIANTPYDFAAPPEIPTALVCFNPGAAACLQAVVQTLYGQLKPTARPPVRL